MHMKRAIRRPTVLQKTGVCASTIANWERQGRFPRHFMLGPRCAAWDEAEVDAWIAARKAATDAIHLGAAA